MILNEAQMEVIFKLNRPYSETVKQHPLDAYDSRTIQALLGRSLVEKYHHSNFLHAAIRLTEIGRDYAGSLEYVICKKDFYLDDVKLFDVSKLYRIVKKHEYGLFDVRNNKGRLNGFTHDSDWVEIFQ